MSPFTLKAAKELVEAIQSLTPEKIKACGIAEAEVLKLTDEEKAKREECVAIIDSSSAKLKELKDAQDKNLIECADLEKAQAALSKKEEELSKKEQTLSAKSSDFDAREIAITAREAGLQKYSAELDKIANTQKYKDAELKVLSSSLYEQADNFEKAQQLIKKK